MGKFQSWKLLRLRNFTSFQANKTQFSGNQNTIDYLQHKQKIK